MNIYSILTKSDIIYENIVEGDTVLLNSENNNVHILNDTGKFLYNQVDGKKNINDIINNLIIKCNISKDQKNEVINDCMSWFRDMVDKDVLYIK